MPRRLETEASCGIECMDSEVLASTRRVVAADLRCLRVGDGSEYGNWEFTRVLFIPSTI